jgi:hypothetical protein
VKFIPDLEQGSLHPDTVGSQLPKLIALVMTKTEDFVNGALALNSATCVHNFYLILVASYVD